MMFRILGQDFGEVKVDLLQNVVRQGPLADLLLGHPRKPDSLVRHGQPPVDRFWRPLYSSTLCRHFSTSTPAISAKDSSASRVSPRAMAAFASTISCGLPTGHRSRILRFTSATALIALSRRSTNSSPPGEP